MTRRPTVPRVLLRQLPLHLPAASAPPLEGLMRDTIVQLLAHLLTSASTRDARGEDGDERQ